MRYCTNCGQANEDGHSFCTNCGTPLTAPEQETYTEPAVAPEETYQQTYSQQQTYQPRQTYQPQQSYAPQQAYAPPEYTEKPMSAWSYAGSLFLMALPLVGFVLMIVWAAGGTDSISRRNLARGRLIIMAIALALGIGLLFTFGGIFARLLNEYSNAYGQYGSEWMRTFVFRG